MTITLVEGQSKELNITLTSIIPPLDVDLSVIIDAHVLPINPGASINVEATIHNKTDYEQTYEIIYYVNEEILCHSIDEVIAPNATYKGICTYIVPAIGSYAVRVVVNGFEAGTSFEAVEVPVGEPDMSIPGNIITADIEAGQDSYCSIFIRNRGTGEGDISCDWYLDDVFIETDSAHLVPGASADFNLRTLVRYPGTHYVRAEFTWNGYTETRIGSFSAAGPPIPPGEPYMSIPDEIVCIDVTAGENCHCSILVENIGGTAGDISCAWYIHGSYSGTDSAHLVPGGTIEFTVERLTRYPGIYPVEAKFTWDGYRETRTGRFVVGAPLEPTPG